MEKTQRLNEMLRDGNYSFRVLGPAGKVIGEGSLFVARVMAGSQFVLYIDSNFERYMLRYGTYYRCTNFDLLGMKRAERECMLLELSGILIY